MQTSGIRAARSRNCIYSSLRGAKRRSNPSIPEWYYGLLRFARNDVERVVSHRQRDRILHLAQRKTRLDRGDAVEPGQLVFQERFVRRQVGGDDAQQVVAIAGNQVALQNLVPFRDRFRKPVEVFLLLPRQLDRDEHADMQAERFLVDGRDIAGDHAARFQKFHPAMAGRDRQADLVGELLHGRAAVGLQQAEDFAVDGVKRMHWDKLWLAGSDVGFYPNFWRYVARI